METVTKVRFREAIYNVTYYSQSPLLDRPKESCARTGTNSVGVPPACAAAQESLRGSAVLRPKKPPINPSVKLGPPKLSP